MNTSNVSVTTTPAQGNIEHARRLYSLHLWKSVSSILSNTHKSLVHMKQDIFSLVVQVKYAHFGGSFIFVANFFFVNHRCDNLNTSLMLTKPQHSRYNSFRVDVRASALMHARTLRNELFDNLLCVWYHTLVFKLRFFCLEISIWRSVFLLWVFVKFRSFVCLCAC